MNRVFREEKKYLIGMAEALQRSHLLGQVMREDPHNGVHGYRIRSLYFDTVYDEDYHEKLAGIETRRNTDIQHDLFRRHLTGVGKKAQDLILHIVNLLFVAAYSRYRYPFCRASMYLLTESSL